MRLLPILLLWMAAQATGLVAQRSGQKALEATVREFFVTDGTPIFVSPLMIAPEVRGNVKIDPENRELLETRFGAQVRDLEEVVQCEDLTLPETCRIQGGGVVFQFFMPEPVENGVLHLAVLLLRDGAGESGQIGREWWNVALLERPDVGWTVVGRDLTNTADGPW